MSKNITKIINMTQFPAVVESSRGTVVFPKAGRPAVLKSVFTDGGSINGIPVTNGELLPEVPGLPEPEEGVLILVPAITGMVLSAAGRDDVLVPGPINRNEKGQISSYQGLAVPGRENPFKFDAGLEGEEPEPLALEGAEIISCVKHECTILGGANGTAVIPGAGQDARVTEVWGDEGTLKIEGEEIQLFSLSYEKEVVGLPEPKDGTFYIVSLITAKILVRQDLLSPGRMVTDPNDLASSGRPRIIGAQGFTRSI